MNSPRSKPFSPRRLPVLPTMYAVPWDTKGAMFPNPGSPRPGLQPTVSSARAWVPEKNRRLPPLETPMAFGTQADGRRPTGPKPVFSGRAPRFGPLEDSRGYVPLGNPSPVMYPVPGSCGAQPQSQRPSPPIVGLNMGEARWALKERLIKAVDSPGPAHYYPKA